MSYYVRVLSTSADCIQLEELQTALKDSSVKATLSVDGGEPDDWEQILLSHVDGTEIAVIERNLVEDGTLGSEELEEFAEDVEECDPATGAKWLLEYFPRVRCIYAFQLLSGTEYKDGWDILGAVKDRIWSFAPSIVQADDEGFSNEDGYHILWQFNDSVEGEWSMAVLRDGEWKEFQMDLGNRKHRKAFLAGEIPEGVKSIK